MVFVLQAPLVLGDTTIGPVALSSALLIALKMMFILAGLLYLAFSVVVIRQIHIMQTTLITSLSPSLRILGYVHLVAAIAVLAFIILVL